MTDQQAKIIGYISFIALLIILASTQIGFVERHEIMHIDNYIVHDGDTLDTIAYQYIDKYHLQYDVRKFREDIIRDNWDTVFANRKPGMIYAGDKLVITWWER